MTGPEVLSRVRDHLQDDDGDIADDAVLSRWLREAYNDIVLLIDEAPVPLSIIGGAGQTPTVVTWASTVREVALPVAIYARIISVCPLGKGGVIEQPPYPEVSFAERNTAKFGIYIYRALVGLDPQWVIGQVPQVRSGSISANVYYRPSVVNYPLGLDALNIIPAEFHELIAIRAALLVKGTENRDASFLISLWVEGTKRLQRYGVNRAHAPSWKY